MEIGIQSKDAISVEDGTVNKTEIQKEGVIGLQHIAIKPVFQGGWAVVVGIVSVVIIMIIRVVTISDTLVISLMVSLVLAAFIFLYFDQKHKDLELEKKKES